MLQEAIRQLELVRSGGADDRLLLFAYLRLKRYLGLFREDSRPPLGEELRARFGELMVIAFLDSLIIRLRDRMHKMSVSPAAPVEARSTLGPRSESHSSISAEGSGRATPTSGP
jgi:hypothetical protein